MNDMNQTLIENLCEHNLVISLERDERDFLRTFDFSPFPRAVRDDNDYHVVDGEEGDHGEQRYYTDAERQVLLATFINKGGDETYWTFSPVFIRGVKSIIHEIIETRLQNQAQK